MKTQLIQCTGSAYENGITSGTFFKSVLSETFMEQMHKMDHNPDLKPKIEAMLEKLKVEFPRYYDEVKGKADGLHVDLFHFFSMMCPELSDINFEHCTTILCKKDKDHFILSHNEDDNYVENNFCLAKVYDEHGNWFITNDMLNMPFGNGISINNHGIIKSINYCCDQNTKLEHLPRYFSQRHISEATSIENMIKRIEEMPTASGYHISVIDLNQKKAASIEVYSDGYSIQWIDDFSVHTNHYVHNDHINHPKTNSDSNSIFRFDKATELLNQVERTTDNIKHILDYRNPENTFETSIFQNKQDPYLTLFNMTFDSESPHEMALSIYVYDEEFVLNPITEEIS